MCVLECEIHSILSFCYPCAYRSHFGGCRTVAKVLQIGFLLAYSISWCSPCFSYLWASSIYELLVLLWDAGPSLNFNCQDIWCVGHWCYGVFPIIWLCVHISCHWLCVKVMEAPATRTNDRKVLVKFTKECIFCQFRMPGALISDGGNHFCHQSFKALLRKYFVTYKVVIPITLTLVVTLRCLITRSSLYLRKWLHLIWKNGLWDWILLFHPIILLIRLSLECLLTNFFLINPVTC